MFNEIIYKNLTDEQKLFVDDFDHTILVSASAGTGKTTTMIRKILKIVLEKRVSIDKLLVVTFTTSAANKMKHDLYNLLNNVLENVVNKEDIVYITEQLDLLNTADFGTIDAFCNKLVKQFFYILDIDPNFDVISSEKDRQYLFDKSINKVFDKYNKSESLEFSKLFEMFNTNRNDDNFRKAINKMYNYLICKVDGDCWFREVVESKYSNNSDIVDYILNNYKRQFNLIKTDLSNCFRQAEILNNDKAKAFAITRLDMIDAFLNTNIASDALQILENYHLANTPTIKGFEFEDLSSIVASLSQNFKKIKEKAIEDISVCVDENLNDNIVINKINVQSFYNIVSEVSQEYKILKRNKNLLDFSDLEHYAFEILQNNEVCEYIKNNFEYIFVDEYQDVNQLQEDIIIKISSIKNLYMIGDLKQSIYRFRQSTPEIFLEKYNKFSSGVGDNKLLLFNKNFRSHSNILNFVNNIFDNAITKECVGIDYKKDARLISGRSDIKNGEVKLSLVNVINTSEEYATNYDYEAEIIATNIANLINKNYKFSDIGVLFRKKKDLAKATWLTLKKYNIPVNMTLKENIFNKNEIQIIYALLKCLYNESDDLNFAILLKSPLINATDDELASIRLHSIEEETFYKCCLIVEQLNTVISDKVKKLRNILRELRFKIQQEKICDVIKEFLLENNFILYYKSMPDGLEKECYILEFLKLLENANYNYDLTMMLDYLQSYEDRESEIAISDGDDSVSLITMHLSKGLDYPAIIVGGFCESLKSNDIDPLKINKELGVALSGVDYDEHTRLDNINSIAISMKNKDEEFEEAVRLLYVALTRAKETLIITGALKSTVLTKKPLASAKTPLDIFLLSLSNTDMAYFKNLKPKFDIVYKNGSVLNCEIVEMSEITNKEHSQVILDVSNPNLVSKLKWYHKQKEDVWKNISLKNSVSSILREEEVDYNNALLQFRNLTVSESLTNEEAMELGTEYHTVMQNLEYGKEQDINKLIINLAMTGKINSIYLNKIDINKISVAKEKIEKLITSKTKIYKETNFLTMYNHNKLIKGSNCDKKVVVQGVIDLVLVNNNDITIIDFKTNRTKNKDVLIDKYKTQLDLYAKAYELFSGKEVTRKSLYSFEIGDFIDIK